MYTKKDHVNGIVCIMMGISFIIASLRLPASRVPGDIGPAIFPIIAALLIIVPSVLLIMKKTPDKDKPFLSKQEWKRFITLITILLSYVILLSAVGFLLATPIITIIISRLFAEGKDIPAWKFILFGLLLTITIYMIFEKGMGQMLPRGEFYNLRF